MILLLIILILLFGIPSYPVYQSSGPVYGGGLGLVALILIVFLVLRLAGFV